MNRIIILLAVIGMLPFYTLSASEPINVKDSKVAVDVLSGTKENEKQAMAQQMEAHLGNYNPPALIWLGNYYLGQKELKKAALYLRLGLLRANIDTKASHDP